MVTVLINGHFVLITSYFGLINGHFVLINGHFGLITSHFLLINGYFVAIVDYSSLPIVDYNKVIIVYYRNRSICNFCGPLSLTNETTRHTHCWHL
jgi:hypothetical protein